MVLLPLPVLLDPVLPVDVEFPVLGFVVLLLLLVLLFVVPVLEFVVPVDVDAVTSFAVTPPTMRPLAMFCRAVSF